VFSTPFFRAMEKYKTFLMFVGVIIGFSLCFSGFRLYKLTFFLLGLSIGTIFVSVIVINPNFTFE
jgi:hypothetical protein